jgi:hypothetical protein
MTRTGQTVYIEVIAEEITIVELSGETSMETTSEKAVSKVVDLIIDISHYHHSLNKRSAIYIKNLNASQQSIPLISENKHTINSINIPNTL